MLFLLKVSGRSNFGLYLCIRLLYACLVCFRCSTTTVHNESFVPDALLRVTAQNIKIGGIQRLTTLVNGSIPGPELRIPEGAIAWIRVYNDMNDQNLTMHWHGLAQAAAPFSDGTPLASQWPIPPHHWFDYEISPPEDSAGTYFYHSHVGFQAVSCSGPLIVEDKTPPYETDGDRIIYLQELFNKTDASVERGIQAVPPVWSGETNGFIINGQTISNFVITNPDSSQLSIISVEPGKVYRFRFIGAHALSYTALGIEGHSNLQVIEADGSYTKPHNISFLQLGSGQRFSTLLRTETCVQLRQLGKLDYCIQVESRERPANATNYAILRYSNNCTISSKSFKYISTTSYPKSKPIHLPPTVNGFLDYALRPLSANAFPSASEVTRRVVLNVQQIDSQWVVWRDSNVTWTDNADDPSPHTSPYKPYLVSLYENQTVYLPSFPAALKNGGRDPATNTFPARIGEVLEIVFQNIGTLNYSGTAGGSLDVHPWHAHGQHYYDAGSGPGAFSPQVMERQLKGTEPVLRDTTMLYRYNQTATINAKQGWRAWRLRVRQPGVWMIHCHTLQHMLMGMQTVWVFGDTGDLLRLPKPDVNGYLTYGGSAYGNNSHAPEVVHFSKLESGRNGNVTG